MPVFNAKTKRIIWRIISDKSINSAIWPPTTVPVPNARPTHYGDSAVSPKPREKATISTAKSIISVNGNSSAKRPQPLERITTPTGARQKDSDDRSSRSMRSTQTSDLNLRRVRPSPSPASRQKDSDDRSMRSTQTSDLNHRKVQPSPSLASRQKESDDWPFRSTRSTRQSDVNLMKVPPPRQKDARQKESNDRSSRSVRSVQSSDLSIMIVLPSDLSPWKGQRSPSPTLRQKESEYRSSRSTNSSSREQRSEGRTVSRQPSERSVESSQGPRKKIRPKPPKLRLNSSTLTTWESVTTDFDFGACIHAAEGVKNSNAYVQFTVPPVPQSVATRDTGKCVDVSASLQRATKKACSGSATRNRSPSARSSRAA